MITIFDILNDGVFARTADVSHLSRLPVYIQDFVTPSMQKGSLYMIILHPKICRQKSSNKYIPLNYSNNIDVVVINFYIIGQLFLAS